MQNSKLWKKPSYQIIGCNFDFSALVGPKWNFPSKGRFKTVCCSGVLTYNFTKSCFDFEWVEKTLRGPLAPVRWSSIFPHFLNEVSPSQISPTKSRFSPISKIWYMHFQKIFFLVIKLAAGIQFLYLSKICWKWELTILVKMQKGRKWTFRGGNLT